MEFGMQSLAGHLPIELGLPGLELAWGASLAKTAAAPPPPPRTVAEPR